MENSKTIVIAEDDKDLRQVLADRLSSYGYTIVQAEDGETAVSLVEQHIPALVMLDLMLPKKDGFAVLDEIRHHANRQISVTKVIVLSNLWSNKDILRVKDLKVDEYFVKANSNLEDVFDKVKKTLGL